MSDLTDRSRHSDLFLNLKQTAAICTDGIRVYFARRERERERVMSKSDTIGIHIRSLSLIRIDTYRASGAENMIASSPLSRWVSMGESEGGLMPPSGIHVAFPPSLYPSRFSLVFALERFYVLYF